MIICKKFNFDAAHFLHKMSSTKESNLHGHTYKLFICLNGKSNKNSGIVYDFTDFKKIVTEEIINILDHSSLNDILEQPTIENISLWIWEKLLNKLPLYEVKLYETESNFVIYRGEEN